VAVAFNFSEDAWVNFKLYGLMGLTFVFALAQGFFIARHMRQNEIIEVRSTETTNIQTTSEVVEKE
ncbi:MAG: septation protein IspZ, partial [Pseudomonadota bacterium]|nr:septation protein IspZ [Pseudomonadota bacterium]